MLTVRAAAPRRLHGRHEAVYRLYKEENLQLRGKGPKRRKMVVARRARFAPTQPGQAWAMDFVSTHAELIASIRPHARAPSGQSNISTARPKAAAIDGDCSASRAAASRARLQCLRGSLRVRMSSPHPSTVQTPQR